LAGEGGVADALEQTLRAEKGVTSVRVNAVTGRVLIQFRANVTVSRRSLLRTHIRTIVVRGTIEIRPKSGGNALLRVLRSSPLLTGQAWLAAVLSIASQAIAIARRVTLISTINIAMSSVTAAAGTGAAVIAGPSIGTMTAALAVMVLVQSVVDHYRTVAWAKLMRGVEEHIRGPLLKHLQHQDVVFFEQQGSGRLMNLVVGDIATIGRFVESVGDDLFEAVISIIWAGGMLLWVAPSLFGLSLLPIPFVVLTASALGPWVSKRTALASSTASGYSQHLGNSLAGIIDIKNFTAEDTEAARLARDGRLVDRAAIDASSASSVQYQAIQGIFGAGFTIAIGFAGSLVLKGEVLPDRTLHVLYWFPHLMSSLARLQGITRQYHAAVRAAENITALMDSQPKIVSGPAELPEAPLNCEITFDAVRFSYVPEVRVLNDVSFTVKPGQMLAIVGPTGSGKSTLLRLLLRHYEVDEGRILLNGQDIRQLKLRDLRKAIGVVGQDVYLFQGTVRDNVVYGKPQASPEQIEQALQNSGTRAFLGDLPAGTQSEVGERGQRLSGGQRQRIAIARALLKDAPVLALDEATSQLDYETEGIVQRSIRRSANGRTLIVVAHRLSTVRRADEIIVLESGQIRERGTHDALVQQGGLYASLWLLQNGGYDHPLE
jgi:ATP-binding cassette subfamily B protein